LTRIVVSWSFFTAMTGAAMGATMLLAVRFLFGVGEAGALPNSARVLRGWFPESSRGRAQGVITTAMTIGGAAANITAQWLINAFGWRWSFAIFGVLGAIWALGFYLWFRDDPAEHPATNEAERRLIAGQVPVPGASESETQSETHLGAIEPEAVEADADLHAQAHGHGAIPWALVLRNANVWLLGAAMATMSAIYYMLMSWYPMYLQAARGVSPDQSSWLASLVLGSGAVGTLFGGWLTDWLVLRTGSRRWGRTGQSIFGAATAATAILASLYCESPVTSSILVAVACCGVQLQVPPWWACATQVSGRHLGALFGLMNMIGAIGAICSQIFFGSFADWRGSLGHVGRDQWDPGFYAYIVVALIGITIWSTINPEKTVEGGSEGSPAAA
jgi:sugar phosphate permease